MRRTVTLGLGLALAALCLVGPTETATAADDTPESWDKKFDYTLGKARDEFVKKLAKWCDKNELEWTANYVRRRAFLYRPDDEKMREYFGYEKQPDGRWMQNDIRKTELRTIVDLEDANSTKYPTNIVKAETKVAKMFASLARKADKLAEEAADPKSDSPELAEKWKERAVMAWMRAIETRPDFKDAHKALGHPKFEGEYVTPFKLQFMKERKARRQSGERVASEAHEVSAAPADGAMGESGLNPAVGTQSEHWVINTTFPQEVCDRLAVWTERSLNDLIAIYGVPEEIKQRKSLRKMNIVKHENNKAELKQFLSKGAKWAPPDVSRIMDHFGGTTLAGGETVMASGGGRGSDDYVIHYAGHAVVQGASGMAISDLGPRGSYMQRGPESWLQESISYDVTRRLTGTTLTTCGTFGKYGQNVTAKPGQDLWVLLARRQVEMDDDVPLAQLWQKGLNDLRGPETVKGYAMIQFLFEKDTAKAQKFVWHAMAHGTPAAVLDVYGDDLGVEAPEEVAETTQQGKAIFNKPVYKKAMNLLDDRYHEWIIKTH